MNVIKFYQQTLVCIFALIVFFRGLFLICKKRERDKKIGLGLKFLDYSVQENSAGV